jgi:phage FluMu gp28-like protein
MSTRLATDGSSLDDTRRVRIDRSQAYERYRYVCPRGHTDWHPTNSHVWCKGCRRQFEAGEDVDPEYYEILDKKTGETIPYAAVELVR